MVNWSLGAPDGVADLGDSQTMFGTLGGPELFFIFVIALIVFGPRKLPEIGKSLGKMIAEFRRASNDLKRTIEDEVETERLRELPKLDSGEPSPIAAAPASTIDSAAGAHAPDVYAPEPPLSQPPAAPTATPHD